MIIDRLRRKDRASHTQFVVVMFSCSVCPAAHYRSIDRVRLLYVGFRETRLCSQSTQKWREINLQFHLIPVFRLLTDSQLFYLFFFHLICCTSIIKYDLNAVYGWTISCDRKCDYVHHVFTHAQHRYCNLIYIFFFPYERKIYGRCQWHRSDGCTCCVLYAFVAHAFHVKYGTTIDRPQNSINPNMLSIYAENRYKINWKW